MQKFTSDFKSSFTLGKIAAGLLMFAVVFPLVVYFARRVRPVAAALDKVPGN